MFRGSYSGAIRRHGWKFRSLARVCFGVLSIGSKSAVVVGISLILATAAANAPGPEATRPARPGYPRTRVLPDGKGELRVDVVDRPSNGTPGANDRAREAAVVIERRAAP
jgi:hypothetical protein